MTHGLDINSQKPQVVRIPFMDETDLRPGQEGSLSKDRYYVNGYFEPLKNPLTQEIEFHFIKRPGYSTFSTPSPTGAGRGIYFWQKTSKIYSVVGNKIFSNTTDLGVTLSTTSGFVEFAETRPGATNQYIGINDGSALYLIASDDTIIVMNNVTIISSSVANPTTITANNHGLNSGNKIIIRNHTGSTPNINYDGTSATIYTITKTGTNTFTIPVNVTVGGTGGTIGVFPTPNTGNLLYFDTYWFVIKSDGTIYNCNVDDPTTWPTTSFITMLMRPGIGVSLARQHNVLVALSDRHLQIFNNAANPVGSPLANIEQGVQQIGCVGSFTVAGNENTIYWLSSTLTGGYSVSRLDGITNVQDIGTVSLRRALTNNFFPNLGSPAQKQVVLTSGTSWTVPADFNKLNNKIEAIGGGAGGTNGSASTSGFGGGTGGQAGGAGAYTFITNFDPLGAGTISYTIGNGGAIATDGTDTTFNTTTIVAKKGLAVGTGGLASACTPSAVAFSGGSGGAGGIGDAKDDTSSGAGGGGGGGGGAGGSTAAGSNGTSSTGSGNTGVGGQGDPPVGGAAGQAGTELSGSGIGSGGGANGGLGSSGGVGSPAGSAGNYGAGGGGGGGGALHIGVHAGGAGSVGTPGAIIITYIPTTLTDNNSANAYMLRIAGHIFYIVNLLNSMETWVYDQELTIWYKWTSTTDTQWPIVKIAQAAISGQPATIIGQDIITGTLRSISQNIFQDNGVNFKVQVETNPLTFGTMSRKFYNRVELIGDKQSTTANALLSFTDDDFTTFSPARIYDMSQIRVFTRNWSNARRRAWRFTYSGNSALRIMGLEFTIELDVS